MNKSFRGLITDGEQQEIRLSTNNGLTGYKIVIFQVLPTNTTSGTNEAMVSIWKSAQDSAPQDVEFSSPLLIGAAFYLRDQATVASTSETIIFDNETFNQNIFVNYSDAQGSTGVMNYYIELEQVTLSKDEATVATLKDMRAGPDTNFGP